MSRNLPVFRPLEDYRPGQHCSPFWNMHKCSNRRTVVSSAASALGGDEHHARQLAFVTWLAELGYLSDDPTVEPARVQQARGDNLSAYWRLSEGVVEFEVDADRPPLL